MEGPRQLEQHIRKDREDADTGHEHHSLDISPRNQERVPLAERGLGIEVMYRDLQDGWALYCNGGIGGERAEVHVKPLGYFFLQGFGFFALYDAALFVFSLCAIVEEFSSSFG